MDSSLDYSELQVTSNFSFLRGASHPEELITHAATLGYTAIALTDHNTFAGIVRAHVAAKKNKPEIYSRLQSATSVRHSLACLAN